MACLYILKNKLMPGFCKIGVSNNVSRRVNELYGAWRVVKRWKMDIEKARRYENAVTIKMKPFAALGRELFNCPTKHLINVVENILADYVPQEITLPPEAKVIKADIPELGKLIRATRNEQGITLVTASGLLNLGYRFLSDVENGKETCHIGKVFQALQGLGIQIYFYVPARTKTERE